MILCTTYKSYNGIMAEIPISPTIYSERGWGEYKYVHAYVCVFMHACVPVCVCVCKASWLEDDQV